MRLKTKAFSALSLTNLPTKCNVCFPPFRVSSKFNEVNANAMAKNEVRAELLVGVVGEGSRRAHKCKFQTPTNIFSLRQRQTNRQKAKWGVG